MRGLAAKNVHVGALMRAARESKELTLDVAAQILGFHDRAHLHVAEKGKLGFSAVKVERALKLYGLKINKVIDASVSDHRAALEDYFGVKK